MASAKTAISSLLEAFEPLSEAERRLVRELGDGTLVRLGDGQIGRAHV